MKWKVLKMNPLHVSRTHFSIAFVFSSVDLIATKMKGIKSVSRSVKMSD